MPAPFSIASAGGPSMIARRSRALRGAALGADCRLSGLARHRPALPRCLRRFQPDASPSTSPTRPICRASSAGRTDPGRKCREGAECSRDRDRRAASGRLAGPGDRRPAHHPHRCGELSPLGLVPAAHQDRPNRRWCRVAKPDLRAEISRWAAHPLARFRVAAAAAVALHPGLFRQHDRPVLCALSGGRIEALAFGAGPHHCDRRCGQPRRCSDRTLGGGAFPDRSRHDHCLCHQDAGSCLRADGRLAAGCFADAR